MQALYQALDTEKQMQQAREEAMEVDDVSGAPLFAHVHAHWFVACDVCDVAA